MPVEKGYVWFTVEETISLPTTSPYAIGKTAPEIQTTWCNWDRWLSQMVCEMLNMNMCCFVVIFKSPTNFNGFDNLLELGGTINFHWALSQGEDQVVGRRRCASMAGFTQVAGLRRRSSEWSKLMLHIAPEIATDDKHIMIYYSKK